MKKLVLLTLIFRALIFAAEPAYRDASLPIQLRVDDLLQRMTPAEKVGQMNMPCVYEEALGGSGAEKVIGVQQFARGTHLHGLGPGGGFFTLPNTLLHQGPRQQAAFLNSLQRIAIEKTRLGIPLLITEEGTHGLMCAGATIFPEGPTLGSTWNLELIDRIYAAVAAEARAIGVHQLFTLVVEPIRDPRLGRNQEAYSEDPFLCSRIAETIVRAVQGDDLTAPDKCAAGLCHYPGQSEPLSGLERGAMEISERKLREVFLPPWEAGIRRAGALGVMATYPAIDGVPAHASVRLLTDILRGELGFEGLVLSEGGGLGTLIYNGLAADQKRAGQLALRAGVDVGISYESGYMLDLLSSLQEAALPESLIDRSVRRILAQKFKLGLFERPFVDPERAEKVVHQQRHQDLALEAAREGIVLLKNDGVLPFDRHKMKTVAVIGPNADDPKNQLGDYTSVTVLQEIVTVRRGLERLLPNSRIVYVKGCNVTGAALDEIDQAVRAARTADAVVLVLGENEWRAQDERGRRVGTVGEGFDAATLELTGLQNRLADAVLAVGKPTVVVLINGRPLAVRELAEKAPALVEAWIPGEKGGLAIAEILLGQVNPSGRLSVTIPRHVGQLPVYYNYQKSKRYWIEHGWGVPYVDMDPTPLFAFGHGLGYTTFAYRNLRLSASEIGVGDSLRVTVDVCNTGSRAGKEVVQLYLEDLLASVCTPVQELRGFAKVQLQPRETRTLNFLLTPDDLALYNAKMQRIVEPGEFAIRVGASSTDIRLQARFWVR
ncbi:MAG: glycoside hydrolase family 3 C-terminal domain-containing protein [candidate division KSB1 bacterium]|nr:glycoside hydrolase family 3 C-terminal domain-containing protein [candidate division KSB1 bacterium]